MTDCPSCGRHVGPYDACPYCGAALNGRTAVRTLKIAALALALGGLALLWFLATRTGVTHVKIGQADAMMNMAYVQVTGQVTRSPSFDPKTGYLSFWIKDDSGELRVAVYQNETQTLIAQGNVPALGDQVTVEGTLRVREDAISLTINVPERLQIDRAEPVPRSINEITAGDALEWMRVRGQVRGVRVPYEGLILVDLRDGSGEIELAIPEVTTLLGGDLPILSLGQVVEVVAPVSLYKDTPQLNLARVADLTLLDEQLTIASERAIDQVTPAQVGTWAGITGQVADVTPFSSGVKCTLDDGSGQITLLLWQDLYDQLADPDVLSVGATLHIQGQIEEYKGELEIVPELPVDVTVLAAAPETVAQQAAPSPTAEPTLSPTVKPSATAPPAPSSTPSPMPSPTPGATAAPTPSPLPSPTAPPTPGVVLTLIGSVEANHIGQEATIMGQVIHAASFSQGFKFTLDDGSGQIVLLMWHDVYDDCWDAPNLNVGATVRVNGEIGQFEGEMQIVPGFGGDVKVTSPGSASAPQQKINALSAHLGQRVTVIGQVVRVEGTNSGAKLFIGDDTGEVLVFIWNNVLERIPNNQALGTPGTQVRVTGIVQEYQSNLEIVPVLPYDVTVLQ